jgi:uncharacterized protein (DUF924 family)
MSPDDVINFWFQAGPGRWFTKDPAFDGALAVRFGDALKNARLGQFDHWATTPKGALGLVILLDQVPRNIHRGSPLTFAADAKALTLARGWIAKGFHQSLPAPEASWFILPFEHAEDIDAQRRGIALFQTMGLHDQAHWAQIHHDIIARFGRFPHRNAVLGRTSTPAEIAFLKSGGFSG